MNRSKNEDTRVVEDFGKEWKTFDQKALSTTEANEIFTDYFSIFPWHEISKRSVGFDLGCGSGRWARIVAPRVGRLYCIDASIEALDVAKQNLTVEKNCWFIHASVEEMPIENNSMDFGYSLGVLHHIPNTQDGLRECVKRLKPRAPFLLYLYYAFDNRPRWFQLIWRISDSLRRLICRLPFPLKRRICGLFALFLYLPSAKLSRVGENLGFDVGNWPLSAYRHRSFYVMQTDALDRFGTKLEQRFSRVEIEEIMKASGLCEIQFREGSPFWCAVGRKAW